MILADLLFFALMIIKAHLGRQAWREERRKAFGENPLEKWRITFWDLAGLAVLLGINLIVMERLIDIARKCGQ